MYSWHYFNPRSHERSDKALKLIVSFHKISIHAPTRGATERVRALVAKIKISIHAPTRGATDELWSGISEFFIFQSTLPREERQWSVCLLMWLHQYFNPRSHERSDLRLCIRLGLTLNFNPRSHERSDVLVRSGLRLSRYFNPRSHERSDGKVCCDIKRIKISIHAPTRGATMPACQVLQCKLFQSTLPREERQ